MRVCGRLPLLINNYVINGINSWWPDADAAVDAIDLQLMKELHIIDIITCVFMHTDWYIYIYCILRNIINGWQNNGALGLIGQ